MAEKHTVAMFVTGEDGNRTQVGWAAPKDDSGIRTFEYLPDYVETRPKNVSFEDDELSMQVAEEQAAAVEADGTDGPEFEPILEPAVEDGFVPLPEVPLTVVPDLTEKADANDGNNDFVAQSAENGVWVNPNAPEEVVPAAPIVEDAPDPSQAAEPIEDDLDETQASEPVDAGVDDEPVELANGGVIVDVNSEEEDEAEFQRLLAEEEAQNNTEAAPTEEFQNDEAPTTRRDLRENEEGA